MCRYDPAGELEAHSFFVWPMSINLRKLIDMGKRQRQKGHQRQATNREPSKWTARAVQQLRARMGLSQEAFADTLGTTRQTIINWERGHQVPKKMACRLLAALERQMERGEQGSMEAESAVDPQLMELVLQTEDPEATAQALLRIVRLQSADLTK